MNCLHPLVAALDCRVYSTVRPYLATSTVIYSSISQAISLSPSGISAATDSTLDSELQTCLLPPKHHLPPHKHH